LKILNNAIQKKTYKTEKIGQEKTDSEPVDRVILGETHYTSKPVIIAHRGASCLAPENTMAAFEEAYRHGAGMVELDVHMSKDGHLVVMHDDTVDRTTNGEGKVQDLTLEELKKLDAGSWFGDKYRGEKIPTLKEVLQWAKDKIKVDIDVKVSLESPEMAHKLASLIKEEGAQKNVFITSFGKDFLKEIQTLEPAVETGLLLHPGPLKASLIAGTATGMLAGLAGGIISGTGIPGSVALTVAGAGLGFLTAREIRKHKVLKGATENNFDVILPYWLLVDKPWVNKAHSEGKIVYPYTINNQHFVNKLLNKAGVDGIITDNPQDFID